MSDDDEPYMDPIPPDPQPTLPRPPQEAATAIAKFINQIDNDNEGSRAAAAKAIYRLLRSRKENFAEVYRVTPKEGGRGGAAEYYEHCHKILNKRFESEDFIFQQNLDLNRQNERMRYQIQQLREHVSDNTFRKIRNASHKLFPQRGKR